MKSDRSVQRESAQSRNPFPPMSADWWRFWELLYGEDLEGPIDPDLAWGPDPLPLSEGCIRLIESRRFSNKKPVKSAGLDRQSPRKAVNA